MANVKEFAIIYHEFHTHSRENYITVAAIQLLKLRRGNKFDLYLTKKGERCHLTKFHMPLAVVTRILHLTVTSINQILVIPNLLSLS